MDTMRSKIRIEYNGVDATKQIGDECSSFSWKDNASGSADTISISLRNEKLKWMKGYFPEPTDSFKAWLELSEWAVDGKNAKVYCGKFAVDSIKFSGFPETFTLSGISVPIDGNFNVKQKNRSWSKTTLKTILGDIAGGAGIGMVFDAQDVSIDSVNQSGKTDLAFAFSLASEYGLSMKLYNDKLVIYDQTTYEKKEACYTISREELMGSYSISRQVTTVYDSVKAQYTDGNKDKTLTYAFVVPGTSGKRQMFLTSKAQSLSEAEQKAKAALRENRRSCVQISLTLIGSGKYKAAECFDLSGFGRLDGKYFVDSVTHAKNGGKYTAAITAHAVVTGF